MKLLLLRFIPIILILFSCSQKKENTIVKTTEQSAITKITAADISKLNFVEFGLDGKTEKAIETWEAYHELALMITDIKKGNLSFFKDNHEAIKTFVKELKENIPDTINTPSVDARITALETKLFKFESIYNLSNNSKEELNTTIKEFLEAVSNLNLQMNKKLEKDSQNIYTH
ncbi:MAG: hypothetical protein GW839_11140 [Flavobacteriales bacterium]|nr:hypothetical protein [Flavobacteriia bacterium]NCP06117.1 hypothetical protein [Flavobacteriales bacterium]PIV94544.1 MAG: hypothetical protein COW44_03575 [Flavobacteriaceae bacterium CG17_big_fil_post_rev_8_21_14_2_50_33_15]PIY10505.1 MAG: hypothetical protein COZ17_09650 [Flavobacteriaceae bacterium CG_4_10_14_3_um_filter_33_47]PJB16362.1 MAG: hypothetical protein CO117_15230 [Flavobacteriaceae bacterium CG_4_9_14_3_um_filter_33_16]